MGICGKDQGMETLSGELGFISSVLWGRGDENYKPRPIGGKPQGWCPGSKKVPEIGQALR